MYMFCLVEVWASAVKFVNFFSHFIDLTFFGTYCSVHQC